MCPAICAMPPPDMAGSAAFAWSTCWKARANAALPIKATMRQISAAAPKERRVIERWDMTVYLKEILRSGLRVSSRAVLTDFIDGAVEFRVAIEFIVDSFPLHM